MSRILFPNDEAERLRRLRSYDVLDTPPEERFDRITRILARTLNIPIALVSLVDADRQWFKSKIGLEASETPRDVAFCARTICQDEVMVVEDASLDTRFSGNPLVVEAPEIRFYAGAPLRTEGGLNMGTLCAIDSKPRNLNADEKALLADLAALVVDELEMRRLVQRARQAETRLIDAVEALPDGFVLYDADDNLVLCNQRYKEIYEESAEAIRPGAAFEEILRFGVERGQYPDAVGREEEWIASRVERHRNPGPPIEQELPGDNWLSIRESRTREGGLVGFRVDITEVKRQRRELVRLAWTDSLTGAYNRHRFVELAQAELDRTKRYGGPLAVLLADVDHFKQINDSHGHAAGDEVLRSVVGRWRSELRSSDFLGRIGGEEFAFALPQTDALGAATVAERLRGVVSASPISFDNQRIPVRVSIGVTVSKSTRETLESLMARADDALYQAKKEGRDRFVLRAA